MSGHWNASKAAFVFLKLVKIILGSQVTVTLSSGCSGGMRSDSLTSLVSECSLPFAGQVLWNWEWACFLLDSVPIIIGKCLIFRLQIENSTTEGAPTSLLASSSVHYLNGIVLCLSSEKLLSIPEIPERFNTSVLWIMYFLHCVVPKQMMVMMIIVWVLLQKVSLILLFF